MRKGTIQFSVADISIVCLLSMFSGLKRACSHDYIFLFHITPTLIGCLVVLHEAM